LSEIRSVSQIKFSQTLKKFGSSFRRENKNNSLTVTVKIQSIFHQQFTHIAAGEKR